LAAKQQPAPLLPLRSARIFPPQMHDQSPLWTLPQTHGELPLDLNNLYTFNEELPFPGLDVQNDQPISLSEHTGHSMHISPVGQFPAESQLPGEPLLPAHHYPEQYNPSLSTDVSKGKKRELVLPPLAASESLFVSDRPVKKARSGRKCRKCRAPGCKGANSITKCLNPCADCNQLNCVGRDPQYPNTPCGQMALVGSQTPYLL
jgi:hypothetical protein